jgi:hypothetical protein
MAGTWLQIRVELLGSGDIVCEPPPGRGMARPVPIRGWDTE